MDKKEQQEPIANGIALALSDLVMRTPGVYSISGRAKQDPEKESKSKKPAKGIRVSIRDTGILVNIHVAVHFGSPIPEIARLIQHDARDLILRDFPEYQLSAVNISVNSVRFDQESFKYREESVNALATPVPDVPNTGGTNADF